MPSASRKAAEVGIGRRSTPKAENDARMGKSKTTGQQKHNISVLLKKGRPEHVGIMTLKPGRGIDQEGKARSVAFRETVFSEAFEFLAEAALGEIARIISRNRSLRSF